MKKLLFVYDCMMMGGTTTALLSLLNTIDYEQYQVDLLLFRHTGPFMDYIPKQVNLLPPAAMPEGRLGIRKKKMLVSLLNGRLFKAAFLYPKYRRTPKGNLKFFLFHAAAKAQVTLSRRLDKSYDAAIGFIEGWSDHYVLSGKVNAKKKLVWIHPDYKDSYLVPEFDKSALRKADHVVLVSEDCRANFQAIFPAFADKAVVMENIVSASYIQQRAEAEPVSVRKADLNLCTVCRCDAYVKGLDRVLDAFGRLKAEGLLEGVRWHLVGDGADLPALQLRVQKEDLAEHVTFYGSLLNPFPYLAQMDMFLLASRYEGKPVSVAEALAMGIPCLVTNYASASRQVQDGVTGLIADNSEEGIYQTLRGLLTNRERLLQLQANLFDCSADNTREIEKFYTLIGE